MTQDKFRFDTHQTCSLVIMALIAIQVFSFTIDTWSSEKEPQFSNSLSTLARPESQVTETRSPLILSHRAQQTENLHPLVLNSLLRRLFDDIISTHSLNLPEMLKSISMLAKSMMLNPEATEQLTSVFERYLDYRKQLTDIKNSHPFPDENADMTNLFHLQRQIIRLQYSLFNQLEVAAFFSQENQYNEHATARIAIRQDNSLNQEQKRQAIADQVSQLSEYERQAIEPSLHMQRITDALAQGKPLPISIQDTASVNERFTHLQEQKQHWKRKVKNYQALLADTKLTKQTPQELAAAQQVLNAYLHGAFTENERKRLAVYLANPDLL